jgi:predicted Zn-dependent protease
MPFGLGYGRQSSGGGCLRYVIAGVLALVGIITYYSRTETNPVTGEKQRVAMTVDQEMSLGLSAAPKMADQMGGALDPASDPQAATVARLGQQLVQMSDAARSPYAANFNFYLLADPKTVNAFALPGGQVFITRALYERMANTAQLAGVLGHEIGHVIHRHSAEHMATGQLGQMLATAFGVAATDQSGRGYSAAILAQTVNQMLQLRYSRNDELESDAYGLRYMVQAGYDPSSMLEVMRVLKEAAGAAGRGPNILATHPDPEARIAAIQQFLQQTYPNGVPANLSSGEPLR